MSRQETMSSCLSDPNKIEKRIDKLFSQFAVFYGHIWRSQFKDEKFLKFAKEEWQAGLRGFTDTVLTTAILNCRDAYELPPTLPQLIHCCKQTKKQRLLYVTEARRPATQAVAESCLLRCKELLAK